MIRQSLYAVMVIMLGGIASCIDPFNPPEVLLNDTYLVYDGYINASGTDTSWVNLTRTVQLSDPNFAPKEVGATIQIENELGETFSFQPVTNKPGSYFLPPVALNLEPAYRINIKLANGRNYQSEWEYFRESPPLDSITYTRNGRDGIQIYVNTHDPNNQSKFYKWNLVETWEYISPLFSQLEVVDGLIVERQQEINRCWHSVTPTNISIFTTASLSQDVVRSFPLHYVNASSNKLLLAYSIEVTQQVLTREAFEYWSELARNNETNGSIFDPFPSQLTGNIRSLDNPQERVMGFFSGGVTQSMRRFIYAGLGRLEECSITDTLTRIEVLESDMAIVHKIEPTELYWMADHSCIDCRIWGGGTIVKPDYWP